MTQTAETQECTIHDFIAEHGLTMEAKSVGENPAMSDMPQDSRHFSCTIKAPNGETLTTPFSVGPGIVDQWILSTWKSVHTREGYAQRKDFANGTAAFRRKNIHDHHIVEDVRAKRGPAYRPDLANVLDCLSSDACSYENARDFEDFAADMGCDEDSRKAEAIYRSCAEQAKRLRHMLGNKAFERLIYETERL